MYIIRFGSPSVKRGGVYRGGVGEWND